MPAKRCIETKNMCLLFVDYCMFRYIIVPFLGICFSVPLPVQEMYQNKPQSGTFSAPENFNPDLVQSVAHSAPKDGTFSAQKNGRLSAARRFSILF